MLFYHPKSLLTCFVISLFLALVSISAHAVWAKFELVDSCAVEYQAFDLMVTEENDRYVFEIVMKGPAVLDDSSIFRDLWPRGWKIVATNDLTAKQQSQFRRVLTNRAGGNEVRNKLWNAELVKPDTASDNSHAYRFSVKRGRIKLSYFYYGLSKEAADGGYYYSFDLKAIVSNPDCGLTDGGS